jgi:hypothetical protein
VKSGDLVVFDAQIVKRIFPSGLFDGDLGTIISEVSDDIYDQREGPMPLLEGTVWYVIWWTGNMAGQKMHVEEKYIRLIACSADLPLSP